MPRARIRSGGWVAALAGLALAGCAAPDAAPPTAPPPAPVEVAVLGDSITSGIGALPPGEHWPALVAAEYDWRVERFAIPGTGYVAGAPDADFASRVDAVVAVEPDVVVVAGGTNDLANPREEVLAAAAEVLDGLRAELPESRLVLLSPFFHPALLEARLIGGVPTATAVAALTAGLADLAADRGVPFLDTTHLFDREETASLVLPDGVHPNAEGHRVLARHLGPLLADIVDGWAAG